MSHIDQGPLPAYNSLTDNNLSGYFASTRMRSHLRRAGLITKRGEIVTENTYRLNMSRKEHKKHVKDMLAQAIVHKTLDLERSRQAEIRRKLEEIAKIELVRRVRTERHKQPDENILPHLAPKSPKGKTKRSGKSPSAQPGAMSVSHGSQNKNGSHKPTMRGDSIVHERTSRDRKRENCVLPLVSPRRDSSCQSSITSAGSSRPTATAPTTGHRRQRATRSAGGSPSRKGKRPISALSSNYDDENETVVYLDDEGRPISPAHIDRNEMKYSSKDPIDTRHLYSLDTAALRKYAMLMAKMEQGRGGLASPYLIPQVPLPPKSPRSGRAAPLSAHRHRSDSGSRKGSSPKRPATAGQAYLHPAGGPRQVRGQMETMCEVYMEYHGSSLSLVREQFDKRQDVIVEQQHCGGNTLTVFRDKMEAGTKFSFISYRHRGYPFSLSIYIDGKIDCRVSVCCEDRHSKGGRIGGKNGHFSICSITGAIPCYKCQVEKGIRVKSAAPRRKLKRPPQNMEEVTVVETQQEQEDEEQDEPADDRNGAEEILVPVDDDDEDKHGGQSKSDAADYDEDFEDSESEEGYIYNEAYNNERGSDEDDSDNDDDDDDADDDSKKLMMKDAANVIKAANRLIKESAINADKLRKKKLDKDDDDDDDDKVDGDRRGERTKRRGGGEGGGVKDKRRGRCDDNDDDDDYSDDYEDEQDGGGARKPNYSSISSMNEDEDYYAYKERMMKKIEAQEKKSKKRGNKDGETKKSNTKSDEKEEENSHHRKTLVDKNGKKLSSTSSALGQAEPVGTGSRERQKRKSKTGKRGKRGHGGGENEDDVSGSDIRDTADEVSDIESEMAAASPRKADSVTNLPGPEMNESTKVKVASSSSATGGQQVSEEEEGEGKIVIDGGVTRNNSEGHLEGDDGSVRTHHPTNKKLVPVENNERKNVLKTESDEAVITKCVPVEKGAEFQNPSSTKRVGTGSEEGQIETNYYYEEKEDIKEKSPRRSGREFHVDLYPKDSITRAEGDFDQAPIPDEGNDRGSSMTKEEKMKKWSKRYGEEESGADLAGDSDDVVDMRRGDKWVKQSAAKNTNNTNNRIPKSQTDTNANEKRRKSGGGKHRVNDNNNSNNKRRPKNEALKQTHITTVEMDQMEFEDAGAGFVSKGQEALVGKVDVDAKVDRKRTSPRNQGVGGGGEGGRGAGGSHFESETVSFPMMKTGQNPYLKAQEKEEKENGESVKHRMKSDSFSKRIEDGDKRKGKYFRDLSPEFKVIRGFVGDDGSEGDGDDDDETYSKLNLLDGRANTSDSDMETFGGKNYVLSNEKAARKSSGAASRKHCTFDLSNQNVLGDGDDEAEDRPNYRVLINVGREKDREKSKIKAIMRQKKVEEVEERKVRVVEDTRGIGDDDDNVKVNAFPPSHSGSRKHRMQAIDEVEGNDIEVKVHHHHPQHVSNRENVNRCDTMQRDSNDSILNGNRYHREPGQDDGQNRHRHHHQFSEEPPLSTTKTGSRDVPMQAVPSPSPTFTHGLENRDQNDYEDDFVYSTDEDHSDKDKDNGDDNNNNDDDGKDNNKKLGNNEGNPETWYRVPEAATMALSEEFMGATEEIHRTKYVEDEGQRYAKHQMAFKSSPDVDDDVVKRTGGLVSVLTSQTHPEEGTSGNPGILSFSVKNTPQGQGQKLLRSSSEKVVISNNSGGAENGNLDSYDDNNAIVDNVAMEAPKDVSTTGSDNVGVSGISDEVVVSGRKQDANVSKRERPMSYNNKSMTMDNPTNNGTELDVGGGKEEPAHKGFGDDEEEVSDTDEKPPPGENDDRRRDSSNYLADWSSGSLSESAGGTTQSSGSRMTDGRSVRKKKRKDRKKAENTNIIGHVNTAIPPFVEEKRDGLSENNNNSNLDGGVGEKSSDVKEAMSKGRVAQLRQEERKFSTGSIPDVIITSADESGEAKLTFDDSDDDVKEDGKIETSTKNVDNAEATQTTGAYGEVIDEKVANIVTDASTAGKNGNDGDSKIIGSTDDFALNQSISSSPTTTTEKSNGKKVVLQLQTALCDEDSSADDVSGIDALIEVLEDQLADSNNSQPSTRRKKKGSSIENSASSLTNSATTNNNNNNNNTNKNHHHQTGDSLERNSEANLNQDTTPAAIPSPTPTTTGFVSGLGQAAEEDKTPEMIMRRSKSSTIDEGSTSIAVYGVATDEVETLISMNKENASEEEEEQGEEEPEKIIVTANNETKTNSTRHDYDDDDGDDDGSMEHLDHQAEVIVSHMFSSLNDMVGLNPSLVKEEKGSATSLPGDQNGNGNNNDKENTETVSHKQKQPVSDNAAFESEVSDLLLKAFPLSENDENVKEMECGEVTDTKGDKCETPHTPSSTPSTPSGRKSSLATNQDTAYIERRRQRKLTVSFAVDGGAAGSQRDDDEDDDDDDDDDVLNKKIMYVNGGGEDDDEFYSWEEAADSEKEEEYEQLERELERSLCGGESKR